MSRQLKSLLIVIPICFVLAGLTVFLYLIDPAFEATWYVISSMALVTVWAFFIAPALPFTIVWVKKFFGNMNFEQSFRLGYLLGCGWGVLALLFFLIASPVSGTLWLVQTAKAVRSSAKENRERAKNPNESDDVFDL